MREIRQSGLEGGGAVTIRLSLPLSTTRTSVSAPLNGPPSLLSTFSTPLSRPPGRADLCVRSSGHLSEDTRPAGHRTTWIGPASVSAGHPTEDNRSNGPNNSAAGARTSVSARCPFIRRPLPQWAENNLGSAQPVSPLSIQPKTTVRMDQTTAPRERGPLCPPAAHSSENPRPAGHKTTLDRPSPRPLGLHPSTPSTWAQKQGGGSADLCVRPLPIHPKTPVPLGRQTTSTGTFPVGPPTKPNLLFHKRLFALNSGEDESCLPPVRTHPDSAWPRESSP